MIRFPATWGTCLGGRTPLDDVIRGSTDQAAAHALIRQNVTGQHDQAPRNTNAHGLVMLRSRVGGTRLAQRREVHRALGAIGEPACSPSPRHTP
jgi:hypothetical protein